jgi:hypothetical protein
MQNENLSPTQIEMAKAKERWEAERTKEALINYIHKQGDNQKWLRTLRVGSSVKG